MLQSCQIRFQPSNPSTMYKPAGPNRRMSSGRCVITWSLILLIILFGSTFAQISSTFAIRMSRSAWNKEKSVNCSYRQAVHRCWLTKYCSIFLITGYHNNAPSSPVAFHRTKIRSLHISQRKWKIANCCINLSWRPTRLFLYLMMYSASSCDPLKPLNEDAKSSRIKKSFPFFSFQALLVLCHTYLSRPRRIVCRRSIEESWWGSNPI